MNIEKLDGDVRTKGMLRKVTKFQLCKAVVDAKQMSNTSLIRNVSINTS